MQSVVMPKFRPTSLIRPALAVAALSLLAACSSFGGGDTPLPPRHAAPSAASGQPTVPPPPPRPTAKAVELKTLRPAARPTPGQDAAAAASPLPLKLVGLSEEETIDLLGRPAEENPQPPGKLWIYKASGCQLSVHLFPDMDRGGFYALDYSSDISRDACLGKVAGEARKRGGALSDAGTRPG
jgi:hypothetical protein